jgi:general secretion pathway protein J
MSTMHGRDKAQGFTLIEVLVAIGVMALMSLMAWRGIDGMLRTQTGLQNRADDIRTLQAGLAQWQTDLDQSLELSGTPGWDWNGQVLRLTRRTSTQAEAIHVVAWTWRSNPARAGGGDWQRWQSPPLTTRAAWQDAWQLAQVWSQTLTEATQIGQVQIHPLSGWQLFVHRGGAWTNPLSSDAVTGPPATSPSTSPAAPPATPPTNGAAGTTASPPTRTTGSTPPDGVRLILSLPPGAAGAGTLTRDWIRPTLSGATS